MTTDAIIARFAREYQEYNRISVERAGQQRREIAALAESIAPRTLTDATADDFRAHMGVLLDRGYHVNTVRKHANMLRSFFGWMYAVDLIDAACYMKLKSVRDPRGASGASTPRPYTSAEIRDMWVNFDERFAPRLMYIDRAIRRWVSGRRPWSRALTHYALGMQTEAIIMLALHAGMRRGEIHGCSLDDLHYDNLYVVIANGHNTSARIGATRQVPYTPEARESVRRWIEFRSLMRPDHERPWLRIRTQGGHDRLGPMSLDALTNLLPSTLGKGWELHRLRHTCATERLRSGMPLEKLQRFLGHANLEQTLAYAQILKSDIYKDLERTNDSFVRQVGRRRAA